MKYGILFLLAFTLFACGKGNGKTTTQNTGQNGTEPAEKANGKVISFKFEDGESWTTKTKRKEHIRENAGQSTEVDHLYTISITRKFNYKKTDDAGIAHLTMHYTHINVNYLGPNSEWFYDSGNNNKQMHARGYQALADKIITFRMDPETGRIVETAGGANLFKAVDTDLEARGEEFMQEILNLEFFNFPSVKVETGDSWTRNGSASYEYGVQYAHKYTFDSERMNQGTLKVVSTASKAKQPVPNFKTGDSCDYNLTGTRTSEVVFQMANGQVISTVINENLKGKLKNRACEKCEERLTDVEIEITETTQRAGI